MKARVMKSTGSWYRIQDENGNLLNARLRGRIKQDNKKITNPIAVGDWVEVMGSDQDYMIQSILPRTNYVIRASPRKKGHDHLLAANIDQAVLIASLRKPRTSLGFMDRFLVTLETFRIPGCILFNKSDLLDEEDLILQEAYKDIYQTIGYKTASVSLLEEGVESVQGWFHQKTTLLSGHSGTGKSTLINLLIPEAKQAVNAISNYADKGVHTTTFAEMFQLEPQSFIIDTPGIKELGLAEVAPEELSHYFPEMRQYLGQCKFHNCKHINEPGCMILEKLEEGAIFPSRYESYLSILAQEETHR
jgi:ribosome biogenesis GTPase